MSKKALEFLLKDPYLKKVIQATKPEPFPKDQTVYTSLINSIISQQLSVKAATSIQGRFMGLFENRNPDAKKILRMDMEVLRAVGLSRQKANYIQNVADFFIAEKLLDKDWSKIPDDEIIAQLTQIKGVGTWTVQMILMFTLKRPDVFPIDDLGIRRAMIRLYKLEGKYSKNRADQKVLREKLLKFAETWRPYRSLACLYLWKWKPEGDHYDI